MFIVKLWMKKGNNIIVLLLVILPLIEIYSSNEELESSQKKCNLQEMQEG